MIVLLAAAARALFLATRVAALSASAQSAWPHASARAVVAVVRAVRVETADVPAELLLAVAQHESDFESNAVSWRSRGRTVSVLWDGSTPTPGRVTCGYLQAMATRSTCRAMVEDDGGMRAGVAELEEWVSLCRRAGRPGLRCALRGHAGGSDCALRGRCSRAAAWFARAMQRRARALGWRPGEARTR